MWRLHTVPSPGEPGSETWSGDSWAHVAGATWLTGSYDPALKLLYWGTGNPGPDWNGDARKGDNLFTCSLVAIDVETGKMRWHFQFTPHDTHDWDPNQIPVLVDADFGGRPRALVTAGGLVCGGSNEGNFYAVDATSGKPLWQFQTGGAIRSAPMSFLAEGKQRIAVAGGRAIFVFGLE